MSEHEIKPKPAGFDIKSFHDAVLLGGDMPLEILGTVVAEWVRKQRNA